MEYPINSHQSSSLTLATQDVKNVYNRFLQNWTFCTYVDTALIKEYGLTMNSTMIFSSIVFHGLLAAVKVLCG